MIWDLQNIKKCWILLIKTFFFIKIEKIIILQTNKKMLNIREWIDSNKLKWDFL